MLFHLSYSPLVDWKWIIICSECCYIVYTHKPIQFHFKLFFKMLYYLIQSCFFLTCLISAGSVTEVWKSGKIMLPLNIYFFLLERNAMDLHWQLYEWSTSWSMTDTVILCIIYWNMNSNITDWLIFLWFNIFKQKIMHLYLLQTVAPFLVFFFFILCFNMNAMLCCHILVRSCF